jgi:hypothetical protein
VKNQSGSKNNKISSKPEPYPKAKNRDPESRSSKIEKHQAALRVLGEADDSTASIVAHHEAGHAAMCLWLGVRIEAASITTGAEYLGYVLGRPNSILAEAIIGMTGPISEALYHAGFEVGQDPFLAFEKGSKSLLSANDDDIDTLINKWLCARIRENGRLAET